MIHGEIGLREPIPLIAMGEGVVRIASLVLAIGSAGGGIVAIDEFENGLHYSVLTDVWKAVATAARLFNVQIFATTHSFECIEAAHQAFTQETPYDFKLHRLDLKEPRGIHAVSFDKDTLQAALEANFEVR
jgi:AAA15 family ATPase/GTPase